MNETIRDTNALINTIVHGDCLGVMNRIESESIDTILCDLPYGTTQNKWDSVIPLFALWAQYKRIIKRNGAIVLTGDEPFTSRIVCSGIDWFKYKWVWQKNNATGHLNAKRMPMKNHEDIMVFCESQPIYNPQGIVAYGKVTRRGHNGSNYGKSGSENVQEYTNYPRSILVVPSDSSKLHPTQKPVALFEYLIRTYTNENDLVLDNCIGSGTTAIAALNTNRRFIGIELDANYHQIAVNRVNEWHNEHDTQPH